MKNLTCFDKTDVYKDEIQDLVAKLIIACNRNKVPVFVSVCVKNDENGTTYKNEMVSAASSDIHLKDDMLVRFVNVLNGFITVPTKDEVEVEFETDS